MRCATLVASVGTPIRSDAGEHSKRMDSARITEEMTTIGSETEGVVGKEGEPRAVEWQAQAPQPITTPEKQPWKRSLQDPA